MPDLLKLGRLDLSNIDRIESALIRSGTGSGAYIVTYREFQSLYQFVQRYERRYGLNNVLLLVEVGSGDLETEHEDPDERYGNYIAEQIAKDAEPVDGNGTIPAGAQPVISSIVVTD